MLETSSTKTLLNLIAFIALSVLTVISGIKSFELQFLSDEMQGQVIQVDKVIEVSCARGLTTLPCEIGLISKRKITTYKHQVKIGTETVTLTNNKKFPTEGTVSVLYLKETPERSLMVNKTKYSHWFQPIFLLILAFVFGLLLHKGIRHKKADH